MLEARPLPRRVRRLLALALVCAAAAATPADVERGRALFDEDCSNCHGIDGEGVEGMGPRLNGQQPWYLRAQLGKFRAGHRGFDDENDEPGAMMRETAQALEDESLIDDVIAYIGTLPLVPGHATLQGGDPAEGRRYWLANCTYCHGIDGLGSEENGAPRLAGQSDWYVVRQLNGFRTGLRGTHPLDTRGRQMQAMATILPDEQAVLDVASFIASMRDP